MTAFAGARTKREHWPAVLRLWRVPRRDDLRRAHRPARDSAAAQGAVSHFDWCHVAPSHRAARALRQQRRNVHGANASRTICLTTRPRRSTPAWIAIQQWVAPRVLGRHFERRRRRRTPCWSRTFAATTWPRPPWRWASGDSRPRVRGDAAGPPHRRRARGDRRRHLARHPADADATRAKGSARRSPRPAIARSRSRSGRGRTSSSSRAARDGARAAMRRSWPTRTTPTRSTMPTTWPRWTSST